MKELPRLAATLLLLSTPNLQLSTAFAQGTAFTYQGRLNAGANAATGSYDLRFGLWDSLSGGNQLGSLLTNSATGMTNGLFTVQLDFGDQFPGSNRWLEIGVRSNGVATSFSVLAPRQPLTPAPYAIFANTASQLSGVIQPANIGAGSITTVMLANGAVGASQLAVGAVTAPALAAGAVTASDMATATNWFPFTIADPTPASGDYFGTPVAAVGSGMALIGAPVKYGFEGAAYLFSTNGTLLAAFNDPNPTNADDEFGNSVAAAGSGQLLIAAPGKNYSVGSVYLFSTNGTLLTTFNDPSPTNVGDLFGTSVAAVGSSQVLIGADGKNGYSGAAYLFSTNGTLLTTFNDPNPTNAEDLFGGTMAALGSSQVLIGAPGKNGLVGSVYLFSTDGTLLTTFNDPNPTNAGDLFGDSVAALGSSQALIGAPGKDDNVGSAYLLSLQSYTPGLVVSGVAPFSITTADLADGAVTATKIGGVLLPSQIPNLDASQITSGVFTAAQIPNLDASKITGNGGGQTNLNASQLTSVGNGSSFSFANFFVGPAGNATTTGLGNTACGDSALVTNTTGSDNTAIGEGALYRNTTGYDNTAIGAGALLQNTSGSDNLALGYSAGNSLTTGSSNIDIGTTGSAADSNIIRIGSGQTAAYIAGVLNGNGSGLTGVALLNGGNTFNGNQCVTNGKVGIGTNSPSENLTIANIGGYNSGLRLTGTNLGGIGMAIENTTTGGHKYDLFSSGAGFSVGAGAFALLDETASAYRLVVSSGGNVGISNATPGHLLVVGTGGAYCDGTTWVNGSDRNSKQDFASVNPAMVLSKVVALPITQWQYKIQPGQDHIGPMAQDFHAAFELNGDDDKHISTVDEGGVALAAIQGLNEKLEETRAENAELKQTVNDLKNLVEQMKTHLGNRQGE